MANLRFTQARRASEFLKEGVDDLSASASVRGARGQDDEPEGGFFSVGDTLAAPFRGIEGAFQDIYGLADTLTGDALPDWDHRVFGESRTAVGGVVEGVSNFLVGFLPVAGQISKGGKLAKLAKLGGLSKKAQNTAKAAGKLKTATAIDIGRATVAGGVADFLVWDGHEARLSDWLNTVPALQGSVTEYLSSNEDDSELEGRLKNVLEGAGLGAMVDGAFLGLKRLRAYKRNANKLGAKKAGEIARSEVPDDELAEALERGRNNDSIPGPIRPDGTRPPRADQVAPGEHLKDQGFVPVVDRVRQGAQDGETFNLDGTLYRTDSKVDVVTLASLRIPEGDLTSEAVRDFAAQYPGLHGLDEFKVGLFRSQAEKGMVDIDLNVVVNQQHRSNTMKFAQFNNQEGIFDLNKFDTLKTQGDGKTVLTGADEIQAAAEQLVRGADATGGAKLPALPGSVGGGRVPIEHHGNIPGNVSDPSMIGKGLPGPDQAVAAEHGLEYTSAVREGADVGSEAVASRPKYTGEVDADRMFDARAGFPEDHPLMAKAREQAESSGFGSSPKDINARFQTLLRQEGYAGIELPEGQMRLFEPVRFSPPLTTPGSAAHGRQLMAAVGASEATMEKFHRALQKREAIVAAGNDAKSVPHRLSPEELRNQSLDANDLNTAILGGPDGAANAIRAAQDITKHQVAAIGPETLARQSFPEMRQASIDRLADVLGQTPEQTTAHLMKLTDSVAEAGFYAHNYTLVLQAQGLDLTRTMDIALDPHATEAQQLLAANQVGEKLQVFLATQAGTAGLKGQIGRTTRFLADRIPAIDLDLAGLRARTDEIGSLDAMKKEIEKLRRAWDEGGPEGLQGLATAAKATQGSKMLRIFNEYWLNSLLSGGRTQAVNLMSNMMIAVYRPIEAMMGSTLASATGDSAQSVAQSSVFRTFSNELFGLTTAFSDSMKFAQKAFRSGDQFIDPRHGTLDTLRPGEFNEISAESFGADPDSALGAATSWLGKLVNLPTQLLGASDELSKQLNYRSTFRAGLMEQAMKNGLPAEQAARQAHDVMERVLIDGQAYSARNLQKAGFEDASKKGLVGDAAIAHASEYRKVHGDKSYVELHERALGVAREATFTTPLRPGSLSKRLQEAVISHPILRLIMPFVRTPVNIAIWAGQRMDVPGAVEAYRRTRFPESKFPALRGEHSKMLRQLTSENPRDRAEATGRMMSGIGAMTFFGMQAANGRLTGRGPSDPEQRRLLENNGWLPYAVKVNIDGKDRYIQYARLDPYATLVGMFADIADFGRYAAEEDQGAVEQLVMGSLTAAANNFTNKTYLTGLSRFVEVLQQPDQKVDGWLRSFAGSVVPAALSQSLPIFEGQSVLKDVNGIYEAVASRIPGLSADLAPVRNILGEPVHKARSVGGEETGGIGDFFVPVAFRTVNDKLIDAELVRLKHGFTPPKKGRLGLNLTDIRNTPKGQSAYDRWSQLHGIVKVRGKTLRVTLRELIRSREYQRLTPDTTQGLESPRISEVNRVIQRYRAEAWNTLLREFPQLAGHEKAYGINRERLSQGLSALEMVQPQ